MAAFFTFEPEDPALLRVASDLARKAGQTAATACTNAECTVGESEALELVGYSEENLLRIDRMEDHMLELPTKARMALSTGLRLYASKLEKLKESEGTLLVDAYDTDQKLADVARCLRILQAHDAPELALSATDSKPKGKGKA